MIPMLVPGFEGQTPGKRLAQIRITNREGKPASPAQLGTRALSFLFLEQTFNNAAFLVRTLLTRFLNPGLVHGVYVFRFGRKSGFRAAFVENETMHAARQAGRHAGERCRMINREWHRMKIGQADRLGNLVVALGMIGIRARYATKDRKNAVK